MKKISGDDSLAYRTAVKDAFQYDIFNYSKFSGLLNSVQSREWYRLNGYAHLVKVDDAYFFKYVKRRAKKLLKGHAHLILGFNTFLPKEHQIKLPSNYKGKKVKKVEENCELPLDVLDMISKTLGFDDLFQFAGVCKNWMVFHKIYWRNFMASQEPLLLQIPYYKSFSFISIPNQKVYCLKMMESFTYTTYVTSSSGYFIMTTYNSLMLINPFTRITKVINGPTSEVKSYLLAWRALLAFVKCSEEFVLVVLYGCSLHVYQSRNCGWVTYSTKGNPVKVVDFVVLHNIIYVITNEGNIGVLGLNSAEIKFLKLKNIPNVTLLSLLGLVNCDEQLLVVDFKSNEIKNVYKIDFSTMNYVKLKTLGDIALFYVSQLYRSKCYALSNPSKWGYESNSMYVFRWSSTMCSVYSGDDKKLQKSVMLPAPNKTRWFQMADWCFRHLQYEVDYSLVE